MADQIEPLPKRLRVAFAAACAQRLLPNYVATFAANPTGNPKAATRMLRELWGSVERNAFELEKLRRDFAVCKALIPDHDVTFDGYEFADDAIVSLAYAIDTAISGASRETVWAAERAIDSLYEYIVQRFEVDTDATHARSYIYSFPIMQAELMRQQADLAELNAAAKDPHNEAAVIARIKHRAERAAAEFFG